MQIRNYNPETDYPSIEVLLKENATFGGQFDEARDTKERIDTLEISKPGSVLVAEIEGMIVGTVTLFEDGRSAWLYRFAVKYEYEDVVSKMLWIEAKETMKQRGHSQVLVYAPSGDKKYKRRYAHLEFKTGSDFTTYWQDLK